MEWAAFALDTLAVVIIVVGAVIAAVRCGLIRTLVSPDSPGAVSKFKHQLVSSLLLGLDLLVAADVIHTAAVELTLNGVATLGLLVTVPTMDEIFARVWQDFVTRTTGPLWFRLILQPLVAAGFGIRAGLANARRSKEQHEGALDPAYRRTMFRQALQDVGKVFVIGIGLDVIFQIIALRTVYPAEAVLVGFLIVALPYQIIRTVAGWLASRS